MTTTTPSLSVMLAVEARPWATIAHHDRAVRELGVSPTVWAQRLLAALDTGEAHDIDPVTASRLTRLRDERRAERHRRERGGNRP